MQVTVETVSSLERRVHVVVPAERVAQDVQSRLVKTAKTIRMDGFRPGKVPLSLVQKRYGAAIRQEAVGEIIRDTFFEAVTQQDLKTAGFPQIEQVQDGESGDLSFTALVEVYPEIALASFSTLNITRPTVDIGEADIDEMIENLRQQRATFAPTEEASVEGDRLTLDFEGKIDGELFEGGASKNFDLVLGSNRMIPGFEAGIVGMKAGEVRDINVTFPSDYQAEALRDKAAVFTITVHAVNRSVKPAVDADFMKSFGVADGDLAAFRADVAKNMARELKQAVKNKVKTQVMDGLLAAHTDVAAPKALVSGEIDRQRQAMFQQFGGGAKLDPKMLPDTLFAEQAERSVKLGLIISQIIQDRSLTVDPARVRTLVEEVAQSYEQPDDVISYYYGNKEQLAQVEALVLEDQVVDTVLADAQVTDEAARYADVVARANR